MKYNPQRKSKSKNLDNDPFVRINAIYLPRNIYAKLEALSMELKQPISKLITMACFNEFEQSAQPCHLETELPEDQFILGKFEHEAELLRQYLMKVPGGIGIDHLIMLKEDIGMSENQIKLALMELKALGLIEEYHPRIGKFEYHPDYRYIRILGVSRSIMNRQRFKTVAGEATKFKRT